MLVRVETGSLGCKQGTRAKTGACLHARTQPTRHAGLKGRCKEMEVAGKGKGIMIVRLLGARVGSSDLSRGTMTLVLQLLGKPLLIVLFKMSSLIALFKMNAKRLASVSLA